MFKGILQLAAILGVLSIGFGFNSDAAVDWGQVKNLAENIQSGSEVLGAEMDAQLDTLIGTPYFWRQFAAYDLLDYELAASTLLDKVASSNDSIEVHRALNNVLSSGEKAAGSLVHAKFGYQVDELFSRCVAWSHLLEIELKK